MSDGKEDTHGLAAFRAALTRQEGQFHRAATYIMDPAKKTDCKAERKESHSEQIARKLQNRNADGTFKTDKDEDGHGK